MSSVCALGIRINFSVKVVIRILLTTPCSFLQKSDEKTCVLNCTVI